MIKHDTEWYRQIAIEKKNRTKARRNYQGNRARRDLEELEALKVQLLREARAERKKSGTVDTNKNIAEIPEDPRKISGNSG